MPSGIRAYIALVSELIKKRRMSKCAVNSCPCNNMEAGNSNRFCVPGISGQSIAHSPLCLTHSLCPPRASSVVRRPAKAYDYRIVDHTVICHAASRRRRRHRRRHRRRRLGTPRRRRRSASHQSFRRRLTARGGQSESDRQNVHLNLAPLTFYSLRYLQWGVAMKTRLGWGTHKIARITQLTFCLYLHSQQLRGGKGQKFIKISCLCSAWPPRVRTTKSKGGKLSGQQPAASDITSSVTDSLTELIGGRQRKCRRVVELTCHCYRFRRPNRKMITVTRDQHHARGRGAKGSRALKKSHNLTYIDPQFKPIVSDYWFLQFKPMVAGHGTL